MSSADTHVASLRAAREALRLHDVKILNLDAELKQLRKHRKGLAEKVDKAMKVVCGELTPDLFDSAEPEPSVPAPTPPPETTVTPPLAPGEWVDLETIRAAVIADVAAIATDSVLRAVAALLAGPDYEVATVGELWDWVDVDQDEWGGFGAGGGAGITGVLLNAGVDRDTAIQFSTTMYAWLESNGLRLTSTGWVLASEIPNTPAKQKRLEEAAAVPTAKADEVPVAGDPSEWLDLAPTTPAPVVEDSAEPEDLTAEEEQRIRAKETKSPIDERKLKAIAEWRKRQAAGDSAPRWGLWSEFTIYLADRSMVAVVYDPGDGGVEFHGEATSSTGYILRYSQQVRGRHPQVPLERWAKHVGEELAAAVKAEKARDSKKRLKAPPKKAAPKKPTPKKKAAKGSR